MIKIIMRDAHHPAFGGYGKQSHGISIVDLRQIIACEERDLKRSLTFLDHVDAGTTLPARLAAAICKTSTFFIPCL